LQGWEGGLRAGAAARRRAESAEAAEGQPKRVPGTTPKNASSRGPFGVRTGLVGWCCVVVVVGGVSLIRFAIARSHLCPLL